MMLFLPLAVIDGPEPLDVLIYAGGLAVAIIALGTVVRSVLRFGRRMSRFLDEWEGKGEGQSLPERVEHLELDMSSVKARLLGHTDDPMTG